ncbi:MAG: carbamoyl phosphate synthase large subunit, partial [Phototrophicales bacterium]
FAKAQLAANHRLPQEGTVFVSVNPYDRGAIGKIARDLHKLGFKLLATSGTANWLKTLGLPVDVINKVSEGSPHILDAIRTEKIDLIINTPRGGQAHYDGSLIRGTAYMYGVPIVTTMSAASATVQAIKSLRQKPLKVRSLQAHHDVQT